MKEIYQSNNFERVYEVNEYSTRTGCVSLVVVTRSPDPDIIRRAREEVHELFKQSEAELAIFQKEIIECADVISYRQDGSGVATMYWTRYFSCGVTVSTNCN